MNKCPTPQYCSDECPHIISYCGLNGMNDIIIPDNATNGDVIKAVFEGRDLSIITERLEHTHWWFAPYKRGDNE